MNAAIERLAELLGVVASEVDSERGPRHIAVALAGRRFAIAPSAASDVVAVARAIESARRAAAESEGDTIPIVAVPFMGPSGRQRCEEEGVGWLDLSGNARILAGGLHILVEGKPNLFRRRGRPASAFAPKSARIARWLLQHPDSSASQREIARATDMDEGFTSRIVSRLEEQGLVLRDGEGGLRVSDLDLLLDAWRDEYDFAKHDIVRGHIAARSGDSLLWEMAEGLKQEGTEHAMTGLAGAWLWTRFAGFRIVTAYLARSPSTDMMERLGFRREERGANVWLVVPNDGGVFHGASERDGVRCVHPVQNYLDLLGHPERAPEAAERLRAEWLNWRDDG